MDKALSDLAQTNPLVLVIILAILITVLLILLNGPVNAFFKKLVERMPAGRKNTEKADKKQHETLPISQTMVAIGQMSSAVLQLSQVITPMVEELRSFAAEMKRASDISAAQVIKSEANHQEVVRRFEVHEQRTDQRTTQMNNLLEQFNGAVASLKTIGQSITANNALIKDVVDNETKSFEIRKQATDAINGQLQAVSLSLVGINKTVGKVGTTMTDMGGEVEGIKQQLEQLNQKVDRIADVIARLELDVRNALPPAPPPLLPVQSEIKTATLPPTTPLEKKGPGDAISETGTLTKA